MIPQWRLNTRESAILKVKEWLKSDSLFDTEPSESINRLYQVVLNSINGDKVRLSQRNVRFTSGEMDNILNALRREGFDLEFHDFQDVIGIACGVRDNWINSETLRNTDSMFFRHASLNCFDFERFKEEINRLGDCIGFNNLESVGRTLVGIYTKAVMRQHDHYPGRHLRYNNIRGTVSTRYQCLRMLDELLCTSNHPLTNDEIRDCILRKANFLRIYSDTPQAGKVSLDDLTDQKLKKLFYLLTQLLNVEYNGRKKNEYKRIVFESGQTKGTHLYNKFKDGHRLSAFTVDISRSEAYSLRREVGKLTFKFFDDDWVAFSSEYPLISMLGRMDELGEEETADNDVLNKVKESDLRTVNYKNPVFLNLKKEMENLISLGVILSVKQDNHWMAVSPISIKEDGDKWALVAQSTDSGEIHVISPETLSHTLEKKEGLLSMDSHESVNDLIIGTGRLLLNGLVDVALELTDLGADVITRMDSPFAPMDPYISDYKPEESFYGMPHNKLATFKAYINKDFLDELLKIDKVGNLISIEPIELEMLYEEYFRKEVGKPRKPYDERPDTNKRLRLQRKNPNPNE